MKRMVDRRFNEVDVRGMLERATTYRRDIVADRWVIATRFRRSAWEVIVEPDVELELLVVITAYSLSED